MNINNNPLLKLKEWFKLSLADTVQIFIFLAMLVTVIVSLNTLEEQKLFNKTSLRPWLQIEITSSEINAESDSNKIFLIENFLIRNCGTQPAFNIKLFGLFVNSDSSTIEELIYSDHIYYQLHTDVLKGRSLSLLPNQIFTGVNGYEMNINEGIFYWMNLDQCYLYAVLLTYEDAQSDKHKTKTILLNSFDQQMLEDSLNYETDFSLIYNFAD